MAGGPKVAILGAGSVGCFIGGAWAAAGVPVTFIGRPRLSRISTNTGSPLPITAAGTRISRRATSIIAAGRKRLRMPS